MYIREIKKRIEKNGKTYEYVQHRLVESIRIGNRPRQHTILNLGVLSIPKQQHKTLANLIEAYLTGSSPQSLFANPDEELLGLAKHFADLIVQKRLRSARRLLDEGMPSVAEETKPDYRMVDVNSTTTSNSRTIGSESIALSQLEEMDFFSILQECSFTDRQQKQAAAQICARMVHPASERETARWLRDDSALGELLGIDLSSVSDQMMHRITDKLLAHKDHLENRLAQTAADLFSLDNKLILYDLTNTYFESPKRGSAIAKYGKSKEKRNDCPQITLALIVDAMGFPKRSCILQGGVGEPGTLWDMLKGLDMDESEEPRTVVIDAGIATEDNVAKLKADPRFEYVAISRKRKFDPELDFDPTPRTLQMNRGKQLEVTTARQGDEVFLLCKSPDRAKKDEAIHARRRQRFEQALSDLAAGLHKPAARNRCTVIYERIGRLKEPHKVGQFYDIDIKENQGRVVEIRWRYKPDAAEEPGEYLIRTSRTDLPDSEISRIHRTLTMIESAFRWLKSDLGLRPNFHQLDRRGEGHAIVSVLAYFMLAPILNRLEWGGEFVSSCGQNETHEPWDKPYGWKGLVRTMSSQTRVTTSFNCKAGGRMDIRTTVEPTDEQLDICRRLQVNPRPLKKCIVKHGKRSARK